MGARFTQLIALALIPTAFPASAAETITYSYDAKGRLVHVTRSGGPSNGVGTSYKHDAAHNRLNVTTATLASPSFELPEFGSSWSYNPSVSGVTFSASGIAGDGSVVGFTAAPDGDQVAFLQHGFGSMATITESVSGLVAGRSYRLSFDLALRPSHAASPIEVRFNGTLVGTFTAPSTAFTTFTTSTFVPTATTGTIEFRGTATANVYYGTGLDHLRLHSP